MKMSFQLQRIQAQKRSLKNKDEDANARPVTNGRSASERPQVPWSPGASTSDDVMMTSDHERGEWMISAHKCDVPLRLMRLPI